MSYITWAVVGVLLVCTHTCDSQDVDECLIPNSCDGNATCQNLPGTYMCVCNDGFSGNETHCEDVDECLIPNSCDGNAACSNLPGTYSCVCNDGFSGNGTHCQASSSSGVSAAAVAARAVPVCIMGVVVIIFAVYMVKRRKHQKATTSSTPDAHTTSDQPENSDLYFNNLVNERNLPDASGAIYENQPTIIQDGGSSYDTLWKSGGSGQPLPDSAHTGNDDTHNHLDAQTVTSSDSTEETAPANLYNHLYSGTSA